MYRVAIVGRPNVGKSSLFNRIVGKRKAIVEDIPGITRDRLISTAEWKGILFEIVDTGGYIDTDEDQFAPYIKKQVEKELDDADAFILVVDSRTGLTEADKDVAKLLHQTKKPVYIAVNKIDNPSQENLIYEFYELGFDKVFPISTIQKNGVADLLDAVVDDIPDYEIKAGKEELKEEEKQKSDEIKVAIVGKPNAGKSSLLNAITGEETALVSNIPGTTRDTVDTLLKINGKKYRFLDTAGLRKKSKVEYGVEFFSVGRTLEAIKKADVIVHVIDANQGATEQDQKIAHLAQRYYKPVVIAINKIDTIPNKKEVINALIKQVRERLYFLPYAPIVLVSAKRKKGIDKLLKEIDEVYQQVWKRISTGKLNRAIKQLLSFQTPPTYRRKPLKIYYATQLEGKPPCFLMFVNYPEGFKESYIKYLENNLRKLLGLEKSPIKLLFRDRHTHD